MRILVCGGRGFSNRSRFDSIMDWFADAHDLVIIHGGARGADNLAGDWADVNRTGLEVYPADWDKYGKAAGFIRNQQMLDEGKPDLVVAFPGGNGTADMIRRARKAGIEVLKVVA